MHEHYIYNLETNRSMSKCYKCDKDNYKSQDITGTFAFKCTLISSRYQQNLYTSLFSGGSRGSYIVAGVAGYHPRLQRRS